MDAEGADIGSQSSQSRFGKRDAVVGKRLAWSLILRRKHAEAEGWLDKIEGIDLTLTFLRDKHPEAHRVQLREPIHLGLPAVGCWNGP